MTVMTLNHSNAGAHLYRKRVYIHSMFPIYLRDKSLWMLIDLLAAGFFASEINFKENRKQASMSSLADSPFKLKPSNALERSLVTNLDKDVVAPLKALLESIPQNQIDENHHRFISKWTLGYITGFLAFVKFQDDSFKVSKNQLIKYDDPFLTKVIAAIFKSEDCIVLADLSSEANHLDRLWIDGFEWALRDAEAWQTQGVVTKTWIEWITGTRPEKFRFI